MKQVEIKIECSNSAFDEAPELEVNRILDTIKERIESKRYIKGKWSSVLDYNGNEVGRFKVTI